MHSIIDWQIDNKQNIEITTTGITTNNFHNDDKCNMYIQFLSTSSTVTICDV